MRSNIFTDFKVIFFSKPPAHTISCSIYLAYSVCFLVFRLVITTELSRWWGYKTIQVLLHSQTLYACMCMGLYNDIPSLSRILIARSQCCICFWERDASPMGVAPEMTITWQSRIQRIRCHGATTCESYTTYYSASQNFSGFRKCGF